MQLLVHLKINVYNKMIHSSKNFQLRSHHFYWEGGAFVYDGRSAIFSGPLFAYLQGVQKDTDSGSTESNNLQLLAFNFSKEPIQL